MSSWFLSWFRSAPERRIVILGKTGVGKSSVANTIFDEEVFTTTSSTKSVTSTCRAESRYYFHRRDITLVDTPGFFHTDKSEEELKSEIIKCITKEFAPKPHAFLIVLKVEKFTELEQAVIKKISQYFSEEVFKYATVLFTHGEQLNEGQTVEEYFHQTKRVSDLVKKCGGRCHVIDNKHWTKSRNQVEELLDTIDEMLEANK